MIQLPQNLLNQRVHPSADTSIKSGTQCTLDTQSVSPSECPCLQTMAIANENASGIVPYNPSDAANNYP